MFLINTGLMVVQSISFIDDLKRIYQEVDGRLDIRAQLAQTVLIRINVRMSAVIPANINSNSVSFSLVTSSSSGEHGLYRPIRVLDHRDVNLVMLFHCVFSPHLVSNTQHPYLSLSNLNWGQSHWWLTEDSPSLLYQKKALTQNSALYRASVRPEHSEWVTWGLFYLSYYLSPTLSLQGILG